VSVRSANTAGHLVAKALRGSWRFSTASPLTPADFEATIPLLYDSGAAGLGWWTIRDTPLADTPSGELLHQAFRLLTLQAAIHQTKIEKVFRHLRAARVEPILIKGWSIARRYPEPGLRPYGDIDLLVRHEDYSTASRIVENAELRDCRVDLHPGIFELVDRPFGDIFARSKVVPGSAGHPRALCDEDHLALLAVHFLKHAGWRPLWLCDIALMLESMSDDFDWDVCLGSDKRRVNWILSVVGLARELLGASINDERIAARAISSAWVSESVLSNWNQPFVVKHEPYNHRAPMRSYLTRPAGVVADLRSRWPNPILATVTVNGTFGKRRRVRYQLRNCLQRARRLVWPIDLAQNPTQ
jgi:putative nucleotidyltransferase-like protein